MCVDTVYRKLISCIEVNKYLKLEISSSQKQHVVQLKYDPECSFLASPTCGRDMPHFGFLSHHILILKVSTLFCLIFCFSFPQVAQVNRNHEQIKAKGNDEN